MNIISAYIPNSLAGTFTDKLALLRRLKLCHLELSCEEVLLESLLAEKVYSIRDLLIQEGCFIAMYKASPNFRDRDALRKLLSNAHLLGIENILLDLSGWRNKEVDYCLNAAESLGITPIIENRANSAFEDADAIMDFFQQYPQSTCSLMFNPLEFVKMGLHPFFNVYYSSRIKGRIAALRINDGLYQDGSPMMPGEGNGEVKELISSMKARSFSGFFSLTPYMPRNNEDVYFDTIDWLRTTLKDI